MHSLGKYVCLIVASLALPIQSLSAETQSVQSLTGSCVALNRSTPTLAGLLLAQAELSQAARSEQGSTSRKAADAMQRPMTEQELLRIDRYLSPISQAGKTKAPADLSRSGLSSERLGVVLLDSTAILARADLRTTLDQWRRIPGFSRQTIAWGEAVLGGLTDCINSRYEEFGGQPTIQSMEALVLRLRPVLDNLIVGSDRGSVVLPKEPRR